MSLCLVCQKVPKVTVEAEESDLYAPIVTFGSVTQVDARKMYSIKGLIQQVLL